MRALAFAVTGATLALAGCADWFEEQFTKQLPDIDANLGDITFDPTDGKGVGEACQKDPGGFTDCRLGLRCLDGECMAVGDTPENQPCMLTAECGDGLHCSLVGLCKPGGEGPVGAPCASSAECEAGLFCAAVGFAGVCAQPGAGDVHDSCQTTGDCMAGLVCASGQSCQPGSLSYHNYKPWPGVACPEPTGAPRPYFRIPRDDVNDFFALPFPNDVRVKGGRLRLDGFPTPGPGVVGFDAVARIVDALEADQSGFSTVPSVFFRFSAALDYSSIKTGEAATLHFVNIDPDSPSYGASVPAYRWWATDGRGKYICERYLVVQAAWDYPLQPETTYAVVLTQGLRTPDAVELVADKDLELMLSKQKPGGAIEGSAWEAYAPLRAWLDDAEAQAKGKNLSADAVVGAAVFTTQPTRHVLPALRDAVVAEPAPAPVDLTLCDGATASPCDDGLTGDAHVRGCFDVSPDVYELHMKLDFPVVQQGTRPYATPADGGGLALDGQGQPQVTGTEPVCVSLTIPKNTPMPAAGWPVVLYGHGTGGTFRSAVRDAGVPLAAIATGEGTVGAAVVGFEGPMHGSRRGADLEPEALFYNFGNPAAAKGNLYQGAADFFHLTRALRQLTIPAAESPTGAELRFDPGKVLIVGHSQGASTGALAAPYEPDVQATVWSGAGAGLVLSLLAKTQPVDIKGGVAVALQEVGEQGPYELNDRHPVLSLIQTYFDPVDPVNHADLQIRRPRDGHAPQHVLHVYGLDDHFTPPATIETFARLLGVQQVTPILKGVVSEDHQVEPPVSGNLKGGQATGALIQAKAAADSDGHFVMFRDAQAKERYRQFVGTWIRDGVPTVVPGP